MLTQRPNTNLHQQPAPPRRGWRRMALTVLLTLSLGLPALSNVTALSAQSTATTKATTVTLRAIVGAQAATLQATPGGADLRTLLPGTAVLVYQRSADSQWVAGEAADGAIGWLPTEHLILFDVETLPVTDVAAAPTASTPVTTTSAPADLAVTPPVSSTAAVTTTTPISPPGPAAPVLSPVATVMATVTVTEGRLNARSGPATDYRIIAKLTNGESLAVTGQSADGQWLLLDLGDGAQGWVSAQYMTLSGALTAVPVTDAIVTAPTTAERSANPVTTVSPTSPARESNSTGLAGKLVFQASQGGAIYLYNLVSGALRPLTSGFDPALSPDGTQVAFTRAGTDGGLFLINVDGSNEHKIYGEGVSVRSPKWSPDGQWIVFSRTSGTWTCYQVGPECATRQQLVSRLPPTVANDPKEVARFLRGFETQDNLDYGLARVTAAGDDYRDLAALDTARTPDWGANGIVYQSTAGLQRTADQPDAQNQVVLADHNLQDPAWQPHGDQLLYQARRGSHWEIFRANADGSAAVALTQPATTLVDELPSNGSPAWSFDGQHIVFLSNRTDNHEAGAWRIWVMNADGSNQQPLPIAVTLDYTFNEEQMVSWGP